MSSMGNTGLSRRAFLAAGAAAPVLLSGRRAYSKITSDVVRIGVLSDMGGITADASGFGSVGAARMAVFDEGGEISGKKIEIVFADHQYKADVGSNIARQWMDEQGVAAIADLAFTPVALATINICREKDRVALVGGAASSDITGAACSPVTAHWADDSYSLATATVKALANSGKKRWFFITADYTFGKTVEREATEAITALGGTVVGTVRHPSGAPDMSSYIAKAIASKADVIALGNVGADSVNCIKCAAEFGLDRKAQTLAVFISFITDIKALGPELAEGLSVATGFYWDQNDQSRAFAQRFRKEFGRVPTKIQGAVYASVRHWIQAARAADSTSGAATMAAMRAMPADYLGKPARLRQDGRVIYDMGVYTVKAPKDIVNQWDLYRLNEVLPGDKAFRPLDAGGCRLI